MPFYSRERDANMLPNYAGHGLNFYDVSIVCKPQIAASRFSRAITHAGRPLPDQTSEVARYQLCGSPIVQELIVLFGPCWALDNLHAAHPIHLARRSSFLVVVLRSS